MKKIIDGKKYDTDTAHEVATYESGSRREFKYYEETLYRKRTGEYFIYGYGHADSRYAQLIGDNFGPGEAIIPKTYEQARKWAEDHMEVEDYESEFGEVSESDNGPVAVTVRISEAAKAKLQRESSRTGRTQGEIVEALIDSL